MNKLFKNIPSFAVTPGMIANAADKLLNYVLPKDEVAAQSCTKSCSKCKLIDAPFNWRRDCKICCGKFGFIPKCRYFSESCW